MFLSALCVLLAKSPARVCTHHNTKNTKNKIKWFRGTRTEARTDKPKHTSHSMMETAFEGFFGSTSSTTSSYTWCAYQTVRINHAETPCCTDHTQRERAIVCYSTMQRSRIQRLLHRPCSSCGGRHCSHGTCRPHALAWRVYDKIG